MKKNLFEMHASFTDGWSSDNKDKETQPSPIEIKVPQKHLLFLSKEKRKGKYVTLVQPFYLSKNDLLSLLKVLKKQLSTGGTLKKNTLEFQGDIPQKLREVLEDLHYRFKH